jgi:hypothetical protein
MNEGNALDWNARCRICETKSQTLSVRQAHEERVASIEVEVAR